MYTLHTGGLMYLVGKRSPNFRVFLLIITRSEAPGSIKETAFQFHIHGIFEFISLCSSLGCNYLCCVQVFWAILLF